MKTNSNKPEVFLTLGLPASGKTYFSERLAGDLGIFFLNTDRLRLAMIEKPAFSPEENEVVYRTMEHLAGQHLEQKLSVICNGNYNQRARRLHLQEMAARLDAMCFIILVEAPLDVVRNRIQTRDHEIAPEKMVHQPLELLERMQRAYEPPATDELVIRIDGTKPYEEQYRSFIEQRHKLEVRD